MITTLQAWPFRAMASRLQGLSRLCRKARLGMRCLGVRAHGGALCSADTSMDALAASLQPSLQAMRNSLDHTVTAHGEAKDALMLGLIAREHVYLEGPPGCAKTALVEAAAKYSGLTPIMFRQLHRDTRLADFAGTSVLVREQVSFGGSVGESIRQADRVGGIGPAAVCILDDVTRAPGEALGFLLRALRGSGEAPKLACVFATGCPPLPGFMMEPLDATALDRFTLQLRMDSLLAPARSDGQSAATALPAAGRALARAARRRERVADLELPLTPPRLSEAHDLLPHIQLDETRNLLLDFLIELRAACAAVSPEALALLSDGAFLVHAPQVLRAQALMAGRAVCLPEDLAVLRFLTTFRVPPSVHANVDVMLSDLIERSRRQEQKSRQRRKRTGENGDDLAGSAPDTRPQRVVPSMLRTTETPKDALPPQRSAATRFIMQAVSRMLQWWADQAEPPHVNLHEDSISNMDMLLDSLQGEFDRMRVSDAEQAGGVPRGWQQLGKLDFDDVDVVDAALWCDDVSPEMPRALLRQRPRRGGALTVVRDVSSSMAGLHAKWGSSLTLRMVELAEQSNMRLGYAEFHDKAMLHSPADSDDFLTHNYEAVRTLARDLTCDGLTNYQAVLREVFGEYASPSSRGGAGRHVLLVTDGQPTQGCTHCSEEASFAARLGIRVHAVFIGCGEYPAVLSRLAVVTRGRQFQAVPDYCTGVVVLHDRSEHRWIDAAEG